MGCDLCGKPGRLVMAIVEGSMLNVCEVCSKFGHVIPINAPERKEVKVEEFPWRAKKEENLNLNTGGVVSGFGPLIKKAREKKGLTQEKLAKAIAERESIINKIESGGMAPDMKISKKLEVFLGIKLMVQDKQEMTPVKKELNLKDGALTIGDLLDLHKRKN